MEYVATTRYQGMTHNGNIKGSDTDAVNDVLKCLPKNYNERDVVLIVEHVYRNERHVSYVTTLNKYLIATQE